MSLSYFKPFPTQIRWSGLSNRGKRQNNEDAFLGLQFDSREIHRLGKTGSSLLGSTDLLFAVSDGIGGAQSGEFASRIAVEKITKLLPMAFHRTAQGFSAGIDDVFGELFTEIHRALLFLGSSYEECAEMGATLTLAWFTPGWMHFAHIGDSRLYYLPAGGGIRQLSEDDTHVGWLFRNGKLTEREARQHPRKHFLQRALGAGHQFVLPQVGSVSVETGDKFLLCTDGLIDGFFDEQLLSELREPPQDRPSAPASANPAERMVLESIHRSGRDNTTAVVVEVTPPDKPSS
jgi:serine/threonine protein phosphatase PrpC